MFTMPDRRTGFSIKVNGVLTGNRKTKLLNYLDGLNITEG